MGDAARPYYSEMPKKQKRIYQQAWMDGKIRVLCATSGFLVTFYAFFQITIYYYFSIWHGH
jgi:hypothetical protein